MLLAPYCFNLMGYNSSSLIFPSTVDQKRKKALNKVSAGIFNFYSNDGERVENKALFSRAASLSWQLVHHNALAELDTFKYWRVRSSQEYKIRSGSRLLIAIQVLNYLYSQYSGWR